MKCRSVPALLVLVVACVGLVVAQNPGSASRPPKISKQTRMELIRLMNAEVVYVRSPFPMGKGGLKLRNGEVSPSGA